MTGWELCSSIRCWKREGPQRKGLRMETCPRGLVPRGQGHTFWALVPFFLLHKYSRLPWATDCSDTGVAAHRQGMLSMSPFL